ncbi:hypothetical protein BST61_g9350 [Cercospora zeina]
MSLSDVARAVADAIALRFIILITFFDAAYDYMLDDTNMTGQCFASARTVARTVAFPFVALAYFVSAVYTSTLQVLQYLLVAACALFLAISMFLAFKTLRPILGLMLYPIYVWYTTPSVKPARVVKPKGMQRIKPVRVIKPADTSRLDSTDLPTDITMKDAPPLPPTKKMSERKPVKPTLVPTQRETEMPRTSFSDRDPYSQPSRLTQITLNDIVWQRRLEMAKRLRNTTTDRSPPSPPPTKPASSRDRPVEPTSKPEQEIVQREAPRDAPPAPVAEPAHVADPAPITALPPVTATVPAAPPAPPARTIKRREKPLSVLRRLRQGNGAKVAKTRGRRSPQKPAALPSEKLQQVASDLVPAPVRMPPRQPAPDTSSTSEAAKHLFGCDDEPAQLLEEWLVGQTDEVRAEAMVMVTAMGSLSVQDPDWPAWQPAVAQQSLEVLEQEMDDVVASAPTAHNIAPLFAQASLHAPQQAPPAPVASPVRPEVQEVEMDNAVAISAVAPNDAPLPAQASLHAPPLAAESVAPSPSPGAAPTPRTISTKHLSHVAIFKANTSANATTFADEATRESEGTARVFPQHASGANPLFWSGQVDKAGRAIRAWLSRWARDTPFGDADLQPLCQQLHQTLEFCQYVRRRGIPGSIDEKSRFLTQSFCESVEEKLLAMDRDDALDTALDYCCTLKEGGYFDDGSVKGSREEDFAQLLCNVADAFHKTLRPRMAERLPLAPSDLTALEKDDGLRDLREDLDAIASYQSQWPSSWKRDLQALADTAPVLSKLQELQLAISALQLQSFKGKQTDGKWFLDGLDTCSKALQTYSPLRDGKEMKPEDTIKQMNAWMVDSEKSLRASLDGSQLRAFESALGLFALRLKSIDDYLFFQDGSERDNKMRALAGSKIGGKLQVIMGLVDRAVQSQGVEYLQPLAQQVAKILNKRYSDAMNVATPPQATPSTPPTPLTVTVRPTASKHISRTEEFHGHAEGEGATSSRKKIAIASPSARDSPDPMMPTADFHPLKDAAMTVEQATGLVDAWLRSSNTMLNEVLRTFDGDKFVAAIELLRQRLQHIDEYLLAENRCWKLSTVVDLPEAWKHDVVESLKRIEKLLELVGDASGRSVKECVDAIVEILRFNPNSHLMQIPAKFSRLYDVLAPTCEELHKKIKDLRRNGTTYSPEPYWNMLQRGDHDKPFFEESKEIVFGVYNLVHSYPAWWEHMVQNNFGTGSAEVLTEMKDDIQISSSWLLLLVGEHHAKAKEKCLWLYEVGKRAQWLHQTLAAEIAKQHSA